MTPALALPMVSLPVVELPSSPADYFRCEHYSCVLAARDCVLRQKCRLVGLMGKPLTASSERVTSFCKTGQCTQGKAIAAAVGPKSEGAAA